MYKLGRVLPESDRADVLQTGRSEEIPVQDVETVFSDPESVG